jgi:large subunit ribosomal protein L31
MKKIHPEFHSVEARCIGCSNSFATKSVQKDVRAELCSQCHPFFTGDHKFVDTAGRIEKFERKYKTQAKK